MTYQHFPPKRAAVAIVLDANGGAILVIKRAQRAGDPWSGHLGFPGGRWEADDRTLRDTAEREALEEVGILLKEQAEYLGRLPSLHTTLATRSREDGGRFEVEAHVYRLFDSDDGGELSLNPEEVEALHWIPFATLDDPRSRGEHKVQIMGIARSFPAYKVAGGAIWGISYRMLQELRERLPEKP